jgi:hypothetical protein
VKDAIAVLAGLTLSTIYQFAKQTNEILDGAKEAVKYGGPADHQKLCDHLENLYNNATSTVERLKIKAAQKFADCRKHS